jgi:hypothetical protein
MTFRDMPHRAVKKIDMINMTSFSDGKIGTMIRHQISPHQRPWRYDNPHVTDTRTCFCTFPIKENHKVACPLQERRFPGQTDSKRNHPAHDFRKAVSDLLEEVAFTPLAVIAQCFGRSIHTRKDILERKLRYRNPREC